MINKNVFEQLLFEAENTNLQVLINNALNEKNLTCNLHVCA